MDKKIISILKKIYFYENGVYNPELNRQEHLIPATVTQTDLNLLESKGLKPNNFETFDHDHALTRMLVLRKNKKLTLDFAVSLFLKGLSGEMPRARQTLMSFIYLKNLHAHQFSGESTCEVCSLPKLETEDKTHSLYTYYLGHSWNEQPLHFLIELEEAITFENPEITEANKKQLTDLMIFIAQADPQETPGQLEKRMAKHKVLGQTDKYKRYGILQTLAECGILPNTLIKPKYDEFTTCKEIWKANEKLTTSHRSDIVLPLAGWKGEFAVNVQRLKEIFNITL